MTRASSTNIRVLSKEPVQLDGGWEIIEDTQNEMVTRHPLTPSHGCSGLSARCSDTTYLEPLAGGLPDLVEWYPLSEEHAICSLKRQKEGKERNERRRGEREGEV